MTILGNLRSLFPFILSSSLWILCCEEQNDLIDRNLPPGMSVGLLGQGSHQPLSHSPLLGYGPFGARLWKEQASICAVLCASPICMSSATRENGAACACLPLAPNIPSPAPASLQIWKGWGLLCYDNK